MSQFAMSIPTDQGADQRCHPWCVRDHRGEVTVFDGWSVGRLHESQPVTLTAVDPNLYDSPATVTVQLEASDEAGQVVTAPRAVVSIAPGPVGGYPDGERVAGWAADADELDALAGMLRAAARTLRGGARQPALDRTPSGSWILRTAEGGAR